VGAVVMECGCENNAVADGEGVVGSEGVDVAHAAMSIAVTATVVARRRFITRAGDSTRLPATARRREPIGGSGKVLDRRLSAQSRRRSESMSHLGFRSC
jgi:hypothetical protein